MNDSPKTPEVNPLDSNYEKLVSKLSTCRKVMDMMDGEGWLSIVGPRINNMINEYSGSTRKDGLRSKGLVSRSVNEYELGKNIGIQEGMINVYNMIVEHVKAYDVYKERLVAMDVRKKEGVAAIKNTMYDSPYAPEEK